MRHIGSFANEAQARFFTDFLLSRDIRSHLESEADRTWSVWVRDEDQITEAQAALTRFQANPMASEFQKAPEAAAKARAAEAEDLERYRKRVRTGKSLFPKMGAYGVGPLTFILILMCVSLSAFSLFGSNHEWMRELFISDPETAGRGILPEVFQGQIWRLVTPIFMHAGLLTNPLHLIFNMMWLLQLGSMIEARKGSLFLFFFVAISGALSNIAQYFYHGPAFYGMSGVVYALAGYVWIAGKYNRASGLFMEKQTVIYLIIWLVVCFTGLVGPVANGAHVAGLLVGMAWGGMSALLARTRPE